jgi:hypothetical protein
MDNPLRALHIAADGSFRLHIPVPLGRLVWRVRMGKLMYKSNKPLPLGDLLGIRTLEGDIEIFEGETDEEHIARTAAKSSECIAAKGFVETETKIVHADDFPKDTRRNEWRWKDGKIKTIPGQASKGDIKR